MLLGGSALYFSELRVAIVSKCILHPYKETPFVINYLVWLAVEFSRQCTTSPLYFVLCRAGHTWIGDYIALITL